MNAKAVLAAALLVPTFAVSAAGDPKPKMQWGEYLAAMERSDQETRVCRFALRGVPALTYYDATQAIEKGSPCRMAVVVIHGWGGGFIRSKSQAALLDELPRMQVFRDAPPLVVAPLFPRADLAEKGFVSVPAELAVWNRSWAQGSCVDLTKSGSPGDDWRGGGDAEGTTLSSYDVIDRIFAVLADRSLYPNIEKVALAGFSAGGQFVGRYAAVGKGVVREGVKVVYAAMSPSTELLFDPKTRWHYGLKDRPRYAAGLSAAEIMANLSSRRVWRGCGSEDVLGRPHTSLDSCPEAMAQGVNRFDRFRNFEAYLTGFPEWSRCVSFHVFEGLGHKSAIAFRDKALLGFLAEGIIN